MILLIGSDGNMGKRYKAIFDYLKIDYYGFDIKREFDIHPYAQKSDAFLIATPTHTHTELIFELGSYGKPILCEKPICKNQVELQELIYWAKTHNVNLQMVNQYAFMPFPKTRKEITSYDYYRHGDDGLAWDCINIVGLAEGEIRLGEKSPIWDCAINGSYLNLADVDKAYIRMIKAWLEDPKPNIDYIEHAHKRVRELL